MRARDSQRRKFWYAFARFLADNPHIATKQVVQEFADKFCAYSERNCSKPRPTIIIKSTKRSHGNSTFKQYQITLTVCKVSSIYEVAKNLTHYLPTNTTAWHGREYCGMLIAVFRKFFGKNIESSLKQHFTEGGVKFKKKRVLSPEALAKARERMERIRIGSHDFMKELEKI